MSTDKTSKDVEKRLLVVSSALEAATQSLEVLVSRMRDALEEARAHGVVIAAEQAVMDVAEAANKSAKKP